MNAAELTQETKDQLALKLADAHAEVKRLVDAKACASAELCVAKARRDHLQKLLEGDAAVTEVADHAVLRYVERVLGLNPDEVRATIIARIAPYVRTLGDGRYPVGGACVAVVANGVVVTVAPE